MLRRNFVGGIVKAVGWLGATALGVIPTASYKLFSTEVTKMEGISSRNDYGKKIKMKQKIQKLILSDEEWRKRLNQDQYQILRKAATESPFTSELNDEKREGIYHCAGCDLELFTSKMKFDSGTGWPSFFTTIEGSFETKIDFKLIYPRTEYHCSRCGGHHGHVFKDGPQPTGERWCNNGIVLKFKEGKIDGWG